MQQNFNVIGQRLYKEWACLNYVYGRVLSLMNMNESNKLTFIWKNNEVSACQ